MLTVGYQPLKIGDEVRLPGKPCPEAASWPNLRAYLEMGRVIESGTFYRVGVRPLNVGGEIRSPGDPVPEAAEWPNLRAYLDTGGVVCSDPPAPARRSASFVRKTPLPLS